MLGRSEWPIHWPSSMKQFCRQATCRAIGILQVALQTQALLCRRRNPDGLLGRAGVRNPEEWAVSLVDTPHLIQIDADVCHALFPCRVGEL